METLLQAGLNNALSATFLALLVACLGRILARRPAVLHCLWFLVLLKLVTPPIYEVSVPVPNPLRAAGEASRSRVADCLDLAEEPVPEAPAAEEPVETTQGSIEAMVVLLRHDANDTDPEGDRWALAKLNDWIRTDWMRLVGTLWLAGTVMTLLISCWRIRRFQLLLSNEAQPASEEIQDWVDELSADLGLGRSPSVRWVSGKLSPMLWALGRSPRLIIPIELWKSLDNRQRATLLVHELAHLRRGDHLLRIFELVVTALYWWNPVLWWVRRALRDVEEQCCDAWVVWAFPDAAKSYAETLLETLDFLHQSDRVEPLLASGFGKVRHLRKRLTMIMNGNTPRSVSLWGALGSLGLALALLPLNASWAQKADEPKGVDVVVKVVDDAVKSTEATATIEGGAQQLVKEIISTDPENQVLTEVVRLEKMSPETVIVRTDTLGPDTTGDGKPAIHLELKIDGSAFVIEADSLKEAISKLNEQVKALAKKSPQSTQDKKQAEALDKAVKALADSAKNLDAANSNADKAKGKLAQLEKKLQDEKLLVIRKLELDKKLGAEDAARPGEAKTRYNKRLDQLRVVVDVPDGAKLSEDKKAAERNAIRKRVESLSMEVREKRVELAAAQKRLSELEREAGSNSSKSGSAVKPIEPTKARVELKIDTKDGLVKGQGLTLTTNHPSSDQKRIDALEKTLQKLLEEVASLKREKSGAN